MPSHGRVSHLSCLLFSLLYDIFFILTLSRLLHRELCVTAPVQQNLLKHEGTQLTGLSAKAGFFLTVFFSSAHS